MTINATARRLSPTLAAVCLLATSCAPVAASGSLAARVVGVYDGDSITVESSGVRLKCRLLGIDAPELTHTRLWVEMAKVSKYAPPEARRELREAQEVFRRWARIMEAHAREARRAVTEMLDGKNVRLAYDSTQPRRDRYGRLLVYVTAGRLDANAEMIRRGLAVADTRFPCDRLEEYVALQSAAQASRIGIWADADELERSIPSDIGQESVPAPHTSRTRGGGDSSRPCQTSDLAPRVGKP